MCLWCTLGCVKCWCRLVLCSSLSALVFWMDVFSLPLVDGRLRWNVLDVGCCCRAGIHGVSPGALCGFQLACWTLVGSAGLARFRRTPQMLPLSHPNIYSPLALWRFEVDRETIMNLPESVLLCLFPNGLVLSRQSMVMGGDGEEEEEDVYAVDVSDFSLFFWLLLLTRSHPVRPRLLPIRTQLFPYRLWKLLWNWYDIWLVRRPTTPPRLYVGFVRW